MERVSLRDWKSLQCRAAEGDTDAQFELGCHHEFGAQGPSGTVLAKADPREALVWYSACAELGSISGQCALSRLLGTIGADYCDVDASIRWAKKAIAQGEAVAAFNLGCLYRDLGKPKTAFRWYVASERMGDTDGALEIGLCHMFGYGTKQDPEAAAGAFRRVLAAAPKKVVPRSRDNANFWLAILLLMRGKTSASAMRSARALLHEADVDGDHELANDVLNLIGKTSTR